jgi:uncharacterized membrane protein (UPF0127 family)
MLLLTCGSCSSAPTEAQGPLPEATMVATTPEGMTRTFLVEMATTPLQQEIGLMFRKEMPKDHGMLFVFSDDEPRTFWMKNTLLPLDILFVKADGIVTKVSENTVPMTETPIPSGEPVRYVLELNAGVAKEEGIVTGTRLDTNRH